MEPYTFSKEVVKSHSNLENEYEFEYRTYKKTYQNDQKTKFSYVE